MVVSSLVPNLRGGAENALIPQVVLSSVTFTVTTGHFPYGEKVTNPVKIFVWVVQ